MIVFSADQYFTDENGKYNFDPKKIGEANAACLRDFTQVLVHRRSLNIPAKVTVMRGIPGAGKSTYIKQHGEREKLDLVIDNTNITAWEMSPYINLALAFNANVEIVTIGGVHPYTAFERCIHKVPLATIERMYQELFKNSRNILPHWNQFHKERGFIPKH